MDSAVLRSRARQSDRANDGVACKQAIKEAQRAIVPMGFRPSNFKARPVCHVLELGGNQNKYLSQGIKGHRFRSLPCVPRQNCWPELFLEGT